MATMIKMTVEAWVAVKDNPKQRDTERHAGKAVNKHLKEIAPAQSVVHAAQLLGGEMYKLDGHTRALLWSDGRLARPASVNVVVYPCATIDDVISMYDQFDSPGAADTTPDALHSAFRLAGHIPKSGLLKEGAVVSAFRLLHHSIPNLIPMVQYWLPELIHLDSLMLSRKDMASSGIAVALLVIRVYGDQGLEFISKLAINDGMRVDGKSCGVDEASRLAAEQRAKRLWAQKDMRVLATRMLGCCIRWISNRMSDRATKAIDIGTFMTEHDIWSLSEILRGERWALKSVRSSND